jgi:2-amino-4-hydroxy-6-hydroxymethyldihydropteridine diphosphokinase
MIIIALGSNMHGPWGMPCAAIIRALKEISDRGVKVAARSKLYVTKPYGSIPQAAFLNAAALIETSIPASTLLRLLKEIEAQAGRKQTAHWGPRTLDLDIIDYKGRICNWKMKKPILGRRVILPHPEAHKRAFVLVPLQEVAPSWHHPVYRLKAAQLLRMPGTAQAGAVLETASSSGP